MLVTWLISLAPLLLVIAAITGFVVRLQQAGVTVEEVVGFIGGLFGVLASTVGNVFIGFNNIAVDVAEFLANVFVDPVYAVKKLFLDLATEVLNIFNNLVQGIVSGINWVINKINSLTGTNMKTMEINFVSNWIDSLEDIKGHLASDKDVVDYSHLKMEYISGSDAFDKGASTGARLFNTVTDAIGDLGANEAAWNAGQTALLEDIAGDTGSISKSVDITAEDLKYFRDIAERESINKITQNTIVPKLEVAFGDIHYEADFDKMLDKLVDKVEEAFDIGPEGIHA